MSKPKEYYTNRLELLEDIRKSQKRELQLLSAARLSLFLISGIFAYLGFTAHLAFGAGTLLGLAGFLRLVILFENRKYAFLKTVELIRLNKTELQVLNYRFSDLPEGSEYRNPDHFFTDDLDLFGPSSFFQYLNRTGLQEGQDRLASLLADQDGAPFTIRQEAIRELADLPEWRQDFTATARLAKGGVAIGNLLDWLEDYEPFVPDYARWLPWVMGLVAVGSWTLFFVDLLPGWFLVLLLFAGLGLTSIYLKKIGELAMKATKAQNTFAQYQRLVASIESAPFNAELLLGYQEKLQWEGAAVSDALHVFSRALNALEQRNNFLIAIFGNGYLLWDLAQAYRIEKWISLYGSSVRQWFEAVAAMDAMNSLGNFAFNHPGFQFPETAKGSVVLSVRDLGHPLIPPRDRIGNDFEISRGMFYVITGANMAGKSTFLRTLALGMVMARTGLPTCCSRMAFSPIPLITSMRSVDSLARNESYFFAELKRLKILVESLEAQPYFVILDEILKGTNSTDKARGSRLLLERLVRSGATGLIATHDLSLCEAADTLDSVRNFYFDAAIRDGELFFDYQLRPGVCSNMNASFLLKKMGIVKE